MNIKGRRGQGLNVIILTTIGLIFALAIFTSLGSSYGSLNKLQQSNNVSFTMPTNGTSAQLTPCGQLNTSVVTIYNATNSTGGSTAKPILQAGNYTISQAAVGDGYLHTVIYYDGQDNTNFQYPVLVTCQYQPNGYLTNSGNRGIVSIILIMAALGIAVFAFSPLREGIFGK